MSHITSTKVVVAALLGLGLVACTTTDSLQLSSGKGRSFLVSGKSYEQIWLAANVAMSTDMKVVERHKPSGVIKSRVDNGTPGKVVALFIQPTEEHASRYTFTIISKKPPLRPR